MHIVCPACQSAFEGEEHLRGQNVACPSCQVLFMAMAAAEPAAPWWLPCPLCGLVVQVSADQEGEAVQCPGCRQHLLVAAEATLGEWGARPGDVVADLYEVRESRRGPTGLVHRAWHRQWQVEVALREPAPDYFATPEQLACHERELRAWLELPQHPHLAAAYYVREVEGRPWLVAEWVGGGDLYEWQVTGRLRDRPPEVLLRLLVRWAYELAQALAFAHELGVCHGHLTPHNVAIGNDLALRLLDFGVYPARHSLELARGAEQERESTGDWAPGTDPRYASPEQLQLDLVDPATDLWSWGLLVLEWFCGEPLWTLGSGGAAAVADYRQAVTRAQVKHATEDLPRMPEPLLALVEQCLQPEPHRRPASMATVVEQLGAVVPELLGLPAAPPSLPLAVLTGNVLNNRGLGWLDADCPEEADETFADAIAACPHHPEATYNRGVSWWRRGRLTDTELLASLESLLAGGADPERTRYLQALVHLERGTAAQAVALLQELTRDRIAPHALREALYQAQELDRQQQTASRTLEGHRDLITALAVSPNGRHAATGSLDKTVQLWDLGKGAALRQYQGHRVAVQAVAIGPDARQLLSGSGDWQPPPPPPEAGQPVQPQEATLRLWQTESGQCVNQFGGFAWTIGSAVFTPHGRFALVQAADQRVRLWDIVTGSVAMEFTAYCAPHFPVALTPDGAVMLAYERRADGQPGALTALTADHGQTLCTLTAEGFVGGPLAVSAEQPWVVSANAAPDAPTPIWLWTLPAGDCFATLPGHGCGIVSLAVGPAGRYLLSADCQGELRLWDVANLRCLRTFTEWRVSHAAFVPSAADNPVAVIATERTVRVLPVGPGEPPPLQLSHASIASGEQAEQGQLLLLLRDVEQALAEGQPAKAYRMASETLALPTMQQEPRLEALRRQAAIHGRRSKLAGQRPLHTLRTTAGGLLGVAFSADSQQLYLGSSDGVIAAWDTASGEALTQWRSPVGKLHFLVFARGGRHAVSSHLGNVVMWWDLARDLVEPAIASQPSPGTALALTPDGSAILAGYQETLFRSWRPGQPAPCHEFAGHKQRVTCLDASPDGLFVLSGSMDQTVRVWEIASGACLRTTERLGGPVRLVRFSADGTRAVVGVDGQPLIVWDLVRNVRLGKLGTDLSRPESLALTVDSAWALMAERNRAVDGQPRLGLWKVADNTATASLEGLEGLPLATAFSPCGSYALAASSQRSACVWHLDWDVTFPESTDWDDGAWPFLRAFLALRTPFAGDPAAPLRRAGTPVWHEDEFPGLLAQLRAAGYGTIPAAHVREHLDNLTAIWQRPKGAFA